MARDAQHWNDIFIAESIQRERGGERGFKPIFTAFIFRPFFFFFFFSSSLLANPSVFCPGSGPASRPRQWTDAEMQADALGQLAQARAEKAAATERADALAAQLEALVKVSSESAQENAELRKALRQATLATMSEDLERAGAPLEIVAEAPVNMTDAQSQSIEAAADDGDNDHVVQRRYSEAPIPVPGVHGTPAMPDSVPPATGIRHLDSTRFSRGSFFVSPDETAALAVRAKLELEVAGNAPPPAATMQPAVMTPSTEPGAAEHTPESERKVSVLYQTYKEEADLSFSIPSDYDYSATTTANYGVPYAENQQFYGKYPQIRELSDYGWHSNYTKERQLWHDKVVDSVVTKTQPQATPWIVYTCGPMGAGQSDNSVTPTLPAPPRICSRPRMGCLASSTLLSKGGAKQRPSATSRCGRLLPSASADARSSDDVAAFGRQGVRTAVDVRQRLLSAGQHCPHRSRSLQERDAGVGRLHEGGHQHCGLAVPPRIWVRDNSVTRFLDHREPARGR